VSSVFGAGAAEEGGGAGGVNAGNWPLLEAGGGVYCTLGCKVEAGTMY
jgi:hypothetical protein